MLPLTFQVAKGTSGSREGRRVRNESAARPQEATEQHFSLQKAKLFKLEISSRLPCFHQHFSCFSIGMKCWQKRKQKLRVSQRKVQNLTRT